QLEARFAERFAGRRIVSLHSGLTPAQRLAHWLAAHLGLADLVLGTRLAVFASLPRLGLIVVDEEHDPSYKQQEGARYSARDLAVFRGKLEAVPVLLGSATPSLESWQRASEGRYRRLALPSRIGGGAWRVFHKLDRSLRCHHCGFTERVPRACPDCGNLDIAPIGRGTERLEEQLAGLLRGADGGAVRVARIDADSTRHKGALEAQLGA